MKAISLWQPWASYVAAGMKRYETRSWPTSYRGPLAIHAAKRTMTEGERELLAEWSLPPDPAFTLPFGAIVATCELVECVRMDATNIAKCDARESALGDWYPGRWAWCLVNVVPLAEPMPTRGAQGLWEIRTEDLASWISGHRP